MKKEEAEKKFEEYRTSLFFEAQRLVSYICLYRRLNERKMDRLHVMNLYRAFFQVTLDALFSAIVIWVDKLFSPKSERGFINFLSFIENNRKIFAISELQRRKNYPDGHWMLKRDPITLETIQEDCTRIKEIEALPNFKFRRDKFYAHFDKEYFFDRDKLAEDAPLIWKDLDHVIEVMKDIINRYSTSYDGNLFPIKPININDIDRLLDSIHKHY